MKNLLLLFFLVSSAYSQVVFTEAFDNFYRLPDTSNVAGAYWFNYANNDSIHHDITGKERNLTKTLAYSSINKYPGGILKVDSLVSFSTDLGLSIDDDTFNGGTGDMTILTIFYTYTPNETEFLLAKITTNGANGYQMFINTSRNVELQQNNSGNSLNYRFTAPSVGWHIYALVVDRSASNIDGYLDGALTGAETATSLTTENLNPTNDLQVMRREFSGLDFDSTAEYIGIWNRALTEKEVREFGFLANNWVSNNGNVTRTNFEFAQTAWSDTLCVPLPDATLGTNQEWVLSSSNIDDVTAWIGSRASAKSVKKSITGGVSFVSNTTYFGDGFSLEGDSLVVVFPADTASIDNIVFKKAQHHLKSPANRGWLGW